MRLRNRSGNVDTTGYDFRAAYDFGNWAVREGYRYLALDKSTNGEDAIQIECNTALRVNSLSS